MRVALEDLGLPQDVPSAVAALDAKYSAPEDGPYLPSNDPAFDVMYALRPASAPMWQLENYDGSQARWHP